MTTRAGHPRTGARIGAGDGDGDGADTYRYRVGLRGCRPEGLAGRPGAWAAGGVGIALRQERRTAGPVPDGRAHPGGRDGGALRAATSVQTASAEPAAAVAASATAAERLPASRSTTSRRSRRITRAGRGTNRLRIMLSPSLFSFSLLAGLRSPRFLRPPHLCVRLLVRCRLYLTGLDRLQRLLRPQQGPADRIRRVGVEPRPRHHEDVRDRYDSSAGGAFTVRPAIVGAVGVPGAGTCINWLTQDPHPGHLVLTT